MDQIRAQEVAEALKKMDATDVALVAGVSRKYCMRCKRDREFRSYNDGPWVCMMCGHRVDA